MLQFATVLHTLRKQMGITQEQIAQQVGVSKAAVSKWETGLSYPDILLLPKIATYLNVSIDTLLGYQPQMTPAQIKETYQRLAQQFATQPFADVFAEIEQLIEEYYACFPLLNELNLLLMNYLQQAPEPQRVMQQMMVICDRIQEQSEDLEMMQQARVVKAVLYLQTHKPEKVLQLLGKDAELRLGTDQIIANAYAQMQNMRAAEEVMQVSLYQQVCEMMSNITSMLQLIIAQQVQYDETVKRGHELIETFQLRHINIHHPLAFYLIAAQGYMQQGIPQEAMRQLTHYVQTCQYVSFPLRQQGDAYFTLIEQWFTRRMMLGGSAPRDDATITEDIYKHIADNPHFVSLQPLPQYRQLLHQLQHYLQQATKRC